MFTSLKSLGTRAALSAISYSRAGNLFPSFGGCGTVFTLHHVRPKQHHAFDPNAHLEITPEFLSQTIETAKSCGLIPARLEDLPTLLENTDHTKRYVCFTLDDGYRNNAHYGAPIFRKHNVPYTIFICPGFVERKQTLWWETIVHILRKSNTLSFDFGEGTQALNTASIFQKQAAFTRFANWVETIEEDQAVRAIDQLAKSVGIDPFALVDELIMNEVELKELSTDPLCSLGGHTMTHCNLARVSAQRLAYEIERSCKLVSSYTNQPVSTFAYPYGWKRAASDREFTAAANAGLKIAVTTQPGVLGKENNLFALKRVSLNGLYQKQRYVRALISGLPFKLIS